MWPRLRRSATWNGPAAPLARRVRLLAAGVACLAVYGAIAAPPGSTPRPAELVASAGLLLILVAFLPESAPGPLRARRRQRDDTTRGELLQMALNVGVAVLFGASLVLVGTDRAGTWLAVVAVGVTLVCAAANHVANERRGDGLPPD